MIEDKIQQAIKPIISIYSQIELDIIKKIAEHFNLNEEFINSDYWYFEKLKELGGLNSETMKLLEEYTGKTKQELLKAMKDIGINAIPTEQLNIATQKGALLNPDEIMNSVNIQNIIKYSYDEIEKSFLQLNKTIEEKTREIYKDIATQTYIKTSSGMYSYQEAILESLDELGNKGISVLQYQTDKGIRNYDVVGAVRRDLLCATRGLAAKVNEEVIKESGNHIIRVSHHFGARTGDGGENYTNHAWWQEMQFFCWNYDGKATEEEKKLPDFMKHCNYGDVQGIVGINCKHFFTVWYSPLKKDILDFTYKENEEQYEKTQQQRYLENGVRKWKRKQVIANKAEDEEGYKKASVKTREWQDRLSTFTEENDLKRDYTREHIKGYKVSTKLKNSGKISTNDKGAKDVQYIGKIDKEKLGIYKEKIVTDKVIMTNERIEHTEKRHPGDYEKYIEYVPDIIKNPDYILEDKDNDNTILALKTIKEKGKNVQVVVKLQTNKKEKNKSNSILTFWHMRDRNYRSAIRNNKMIYKKLDKNE